MAILRSYDFELKMPLRWDEKEGVVYDLTFLWRGVPIVNDMVIKRSNEWWNQAKPSSFFFTEYAKLRPVEFFKSMLESVESDFLEPVDPDIRITINPIHAFPVDRSHVIYEAEDAKEKRIKREEQKKRLGKLPDDLFEIEFFLDIYNFSNCSAYSGDGISFKFLTYRADIESFVDQLEAERKEIVSMYADNPEGNGQSDKESDYIS